MDPYNQPEETHLESHGPFSLAPRILADLPVIQVYRIKIRGELTTGARDSRDTLEKSLLGKGFPGPGERHCQPFRFRHVKSGSQDSKLVPRIQFLSLRKSPPPSFTIQTQSNMSNV